MLTVAVAIGALVFATGALATSKPPAYQNQAGRTQSVVQKGAKASVGTTKTVGQLPFTGTDLAVFAAGAVGLLGAGFSLRRVGARNR